MRRVSVILFAVVLMVIMAGNLFAQDMMMKDMGKEEKPKGADAKKMMMGGMGMMGDKGAMGGGMMGGDMMCPMCGKKMGDKGMMGGQGMMCSMCKKKMSDKGMMCPMCGKKMGDQGTGKMDMEAHMAEMAKMLNLSEDQQAKLKALHIAHKKAMIMKKAEREVAEIELQELVQKDEMDMNAIEMQIQKIAKLEAEMKYSQIKIMADAMSHMKPEQKMNFKKMMMGQKGQMMGCCEKVDADKPAPEAAPEAHLEHHQ